MTDTALHGYDPNAIAEESPYDELPAFDSYLGKKGAVRSYTFENGDTQAKVDFTITEGPKGTKGRKATLSFPTQPEYYFIVDRERVQMTKEDDRNNEWAEWCKVIATLQRALELQPPDLATLQSSETVLEWIRGGEGAYVSFGAKTNPKSGFADVTCGRRASGQRFIALRPALAQVRDKRTKEPVPGLTYEAQARQAIAKFEAKGA